MSRAFVKELDEQADNGLPERPQSPHTNYVTPPGLAQLQERVRELSALRDVLAGKEDLASQQQLRHVERDLHFYTERIKRAVLVRPEIQPDDKVHFGAAVDVEDDEGEKLHFAIVGEDEADAAQGKISWVSPLAKALLNARVGDRVTWKRPAGDKELEVIAIGKA
jgi:transcription elongation factor GreB